MHLALVQKLDHVSNPQLQIQNLLQFSLLLLHDSSCHATVGAQDDYQDDYAALSGPNSQPGMSPGPKPKAGGAVQRLHLQNCPALVLGALGGEAHTQSPSAVMQALAGCQTLD